MKTVILGSVIAALILAGCGGESACCQANHNNIGEQSSNIGPQAVITGLPDTALTGDQITANGDQSNDDKGIVSYEWTVNGTPVDAPTITFDHAGDYTVCLTVKDEEGLSNQTCHTINVSDPVAQSKPPVAVITLTGENSLTVGSFHTFNCLESYDQDTIGNSDPKAAIQSCTWTIQSYKEDGTEGRTCAAGDSFKTSEAFEICGYAYKIIATLTVTDDEGETATVTKTYNVIH